MADIRFTTHLLACLKELDKGTQYAYQIQQTTGMPSGVVIPILHRLKSQGYARSRKERGSAKKLGRPLRVYFTLTRKGKKLVKEARDRGRL